MSRKSAAALSIAAQGIPQRISPPEGLSQFQAEMWVRVVNTKPIEWFGEDSAPLLVEYVRCVETLDRLEGMVRMALDGAEDLDMFKLLKARDAEARRANSLAGALRLTNQSRYTPQAAATAAKKAQIADKPWQSAA